MIIGGTGSGRPGPERRRNAFQGGTMQESVLRDRAGAIGKELSESKKALHQANVFSSLVHLRKALEKFIPASMLPADEKNIAEEINRLQKEISENRTFKDTFGPVTFQDGNFRTSLFFINQLIGITEEALTEGVDFTPDEPAAPGTPEMTPEAIDQLAAIAIRFLDSGETARAMKIINGDERIVTAVLVSYNRAGIRCRRDGRCDEAIAAFRKALTVCPDDEGLYYNLARAYMDKREKKLAVDAIRRSLQINPDFAEAQTLLQRVQAG